MDRLLSLLSILHGVTGFSITKFGIQEPESNLNPVLDLYQHNVTYKKVESLPVCLHDVQPHFKLVTRGSEEGLPLSHLVILIHGFNSWPSIWADNMAESILTRDLEREGLGVLVIDWQEGSRLDHHPFL